jgi:amidohydrolase family protein
MKCWPSALLASLLSAGAFAAAPAPGTPLVDHHMHIFSPESVRVLGIICKKLGPDACPEHFVSSTAQDAAEALDSAGISKGAFLATGFYYGSPELADQGLDVVRETRAENTYVVEQARKQCGRFVTFIGVDPLAVGALDEIAYWAGKPGVVGVKLHLWNSDVDFRTPEKVRKLAAVFKAAGENKLSLIVHMSNRTPDYGPKDVAIFLRDVFPLAKGVTVQIAHIAGGGGVNSKILATLGAFGDAIARDPAATQNLIFDLAEVPETSPTDKANPQDVAAMRDMMRKIGLKHFVLASDWQKGTDLKQYYTREKVVLGLHDDEWNELAANEAPYMHASTATVSCSH